jgi:hypothetical protein
MSYLNLPDDKVPVKGFPQRIVSAVKNFQELPGKVSNIADLAFPDSARDSSAKNAFRHSLGTGIMAQKMGANQGGILGFLAPKIAKGLGYGWEAMGAMDYATDPKHRLDTKYDLNANAIGAQMAGQTKDEASLIEALKRMATDSRQTSPVGIFAPSPGYMTRSVK